MHLIPFDATRVWWQFIRVTEVDDSLRDRRGVLVTPTLLLDPNSVEKDDRWEMVDKVRLDGDADVLFTRDLAYIDETGLTGTWCVDPVISEANGDVLRISEQFFF